MNQVIERIAEELYEAQVQLAIDRGEVSPDVIETGISIQAFTTEPYGALSETLKDTYREQARQALGL